MIVDEEMVLMFDVIDVMYPVPNEAENKLDYKAFRIIQVLEYGEIAIKLKEIVEKCKENGYMFGTIQVIAESALNGEVFKYGNHLDYTDGELDLDKPLWENTGKTQGYA